MGWPAIGSPFVSDRLVYLENFVCCQLIFQESLVGLLDGMAQFGLIWLSVFENRLCAQQCPWQACSSVEARPSLPETPMNLLLVHRLCSAGVTFNGPVTSFFIVLLRPRCRSWLGMGCYLGDRGADGKKLVEPIHMKQARRPGSQQVQQHSVQ